MSLREQVDQYGTGSDTILGWNFRDKFVQSNVDPGGSFVRGASVLIAAGPPSLDQATATVNNTPGPGFNSVAETELVEAYPIGLIDNIGIGQNKGLQQIFEIGSDRRYFIPGRTISQVSLSRVMFDGPSLMKALFNFYIPAEQPWNTPQQAVKTGQGDGSTATLGNQPGFDSTFLNLGSELFNRPIGLLLLFHNNNNQPVAATYLEYCFLRAHQFNISASSTLIAESAQADFDRMVPINMNVERLFR